MTSGRPTGSVATPGRILRKSLQDSAKLATRTRKLLEGRLNAIERALENVTDPWNPQEEMIDSLLKILAALDRTVEQTGRLLTQKHTPSETTETASAADIMQELTKGKKTK
jgi:hypothetical protein